jgi:hypothetical protein
MMPIQIISSPEGHHERMVMSNFNAPTVKWAARLLAEEVSIVTLK